MNKSGAHIQVVDDKIEIVRALRRSLTVHGYKVFIITIPGVGYRFNDEAE
jgi:DNA-binding winged helix-turn-helix (wHTH) protein